MNHDDRALPGKVRMPQRCSSTKSFQTTDAFSNNRPIAEGGKGEGSSVQVAQQVVIEPLSDDIRQNVAMGNTLVSPADLRFRLEWYFSAFGSDVDCDYDGNPGGLSTDALNGKVVGAPERSGTFLATLFAFNHRVLDISPFRVWQWALVVTDADKFTTASSWAGSAAYMAMANAVHKSAAEGAAPIYTLNTLVEARGPEVNNSLLFVNPYGGNFEQILFNADAVDDASGEPAPRDAVSIRVHSLYGDVLVKVFVPGTYRALLTARDSGGANTAVFEWRFKGQALDTTNSSNGPNGYGCQNNALVVDVVLFDSAFSCDCEFTTSAGDNCDVERATPSAKVGTQEVVIGLLAGIVAVSVLLVVAVVSHRRHIRLKAYDFAQEIRTLTEQGRTREKDDSEDSIHSEDVVEVVVHKTPQEINRRHLSVLEQIGAGAFGSVTKALLVSSDGPPRFVAAKTVSPKLDPIQLATATRDLMREAATMAAISTHPNLITLVGVVTCGNPKLLVVSYCDRGDVLRLLQARGNGESAAFMGVDRATTNAKIAIEVASGMARRLCPPIRPRLGPIINLQ